MAHKRILSLRKGYEGPIYPSGGGGDDPPWDDLDELGKQFLRDKAKLEEQFEIISNSDLAPQHKKGQLEALRVEVLQLQEDYQKMVVDKQNKLQEEHMEEIWQLQETADELGQQEERLRNIHLEVATTDTTAAANAAGEQKRMFEQTKAEYVEKLNLQIEQAEIQRREIRRNRLSGR